MSASPNSSHQLYILPEPGLLDQLEQVRSLAPLSSYTPEAVFYARKRRPRRCAACIQSRQCSALAKGI